MATLIHLGIDSGALTGWAKAEGGLIQSCGLVDVSDEGPLAIPTVIGGRVFIEFPVHYPEGRNNKDGRFVDPNDLIKLAGRAGRAQERFLALGNQVQLVFPYQWKGQVPKGISHNRIRAKLTPGEATVVAQGIRGLTDKRAENVWDAIGIVLWALEKDGVR